MGEKSHLIERYEKAWVFFGLGMIVVFLILIGYLMVAHGQTNPVGAGRVDVATVRTEGQFANPRIERVGNEYVAYIQAFAFSFLPAEMRVTAGRRVTFYVTSPDVMHSFTIVGTNINMQVIPGEIGKVSHTFDEPGEYLIICNEYCGIAHANMISRIIVEPN
ncbi:cytochrome c oxidase subunit II [uncultured Meiothermus sp.]|jgi:cytochrome c oxidase subunit 2|uniref:cytochrome c oxidase subunit II n=1 Tax=uncultured Meiothermus sp. TaxID=157471 RepID=UPI0026346391|nr:cytochrome c oxidase subunit II [uncultured Meiothermus sp.]